MRLSRLHIAGFKSFPDRSELGFDDGVTAIVGPNGCGKSNVVDAITWVLGEQSAKSLRGERMEDVIFNGSDARKPTGTAEVRLKLSDVAQGAMTAPAGTDLDPLLDEQPILTRDVEIGRRLYRSGESEYLIDGEVCRLKDVHELLMDSGLGVKAYAVIEQGKIGQILSSRPAERRMLIEEAAGVTKYKSRRRSAELKLEAAQQNLTRVDDIVFEVEKQRGALKRQAARARRYKRLREELRTWEQVQFARRHAGLAREIASALARLEDARGRETSAAAHVASLETALEAVHLGLTEAEADSTATREQAHARELQMGRRQQQVQFDTQQIAQLALQAEGFSAEATELEARREPAAQAILEQRDAATRARQALGEATGRVATHEEAYGRAHAAVQAVEAASDSTRAAVLSAITTLSALSQARDHAAAVRDRVAAERERLEIEARELVAEVERTRQSREDASESLAEARLRLERVRAERVDADADVARTRAARDQAAQDLQASERHLAGASARLRSLEELEGSRATFGDAARFLLSSAGSAVDPQGAVADHLLVERSYERAVDALMGELLQYVLVESTDNVATALRLLSERDAGRSGFVVLADARGSVSLDSPLIPPGGARALSSVVRATGPHAHAVGRLIGRALIVQTFDEARALAEDAAVPVATMTGEVFRGAWLIQGGSRQDVRGILETRAEMLSLQDTVQAVTATVRDRTEQLAERGREIVRCEARLAELTSNQHECEKAIVGFEAQVARMSDEWTRVTRRRDVVTTEGARADEEHVSADRRREEAVAAIATHEEHQRAAESSLSGVLTQLQASRADAESVARLLQEARAEHAALTERVSLLDGEARRLVDTAHELETRIISRRAEIARTEGLRTDLGRAIRDTEQALDEDMRTLDELKAKVRELDERVLDLRGQFNQREQAIRGARHSLEAVRADVRQAELVQARASADLDHLSNTCFEAVGLQLDEVVRVVERMEAAGELASRSRQAATVSEEDEDSDGRGESLDEQAAVQGVATDSEALAGAAAAAVSDMPDSVVDPDAVVVSLRKTIERLGPVNMMAIEQFDELESRHLFLTTQRKDLLDSIAQTGEAIRKIDKTTRERFAEAFEAVNRHFETTFTTLFGGGRAGLTLLDQESDTESGIDIIAQPPGKRLQNVQLLSGGEKALTAMALMFAIFKYRPSPFCLLDEIDAPLDDANIGRFVETLKGMQDHTQFILITHNRKTMEIANRLYGVTMEEPGVSKLISLQLN